MRYWEDLAVGETHRYGRHALTYDDITAFAARFKMPAVVGSDETAAPGFLLCCIAMRLLVEHALAKMASLGSPGVDHIDWPTPAHAGDIVTLTTEVLSSRVLRSRPEMGLIKQRVVLVNENDAPVARMWTNALVARREVSS